MATDMKNQMLLPREVNTSYAQAVHQMMLMGYFDTEFTMYGSAYLDRDGKRKFIVSANEDYIYRFHETAPFVGHCPSPVEIYSEKRKVPAGYEEDIAKQVKYKLALKLQNEYAYDMLMPFKKIQDLEAADRLYADIEAYREKIEPLFSKDHYRLCLGLVDMCHHKKLLSAKSYLNVKKWIDYNLKQMDEDLQFSDVFNKTFYSFAYRRSDGVVKYYTNAQHESAYRARMDVEKKGEHPTLIFSKKWQYNYRYRLVDAKADHTELVKSLFDEDFLDIIDRVYNTAVEMPTSIAQSLEKACNDGCSIEVMNKLKEHYNLLWNLKL